MRKLDENEINRRVDVAVLYWTGEITVDEAARRLSISTSGFKTFLTEYGNAVRSKCSTLSGHVCKICNISLSSRRSFVAHLSSAHKASPLTCATCSVLLTEDNTANCTMYVCKSCKKQNDNRRNAEIRSIVMGHYGNRCACCSESAAEFLTIDHVNGDGNKHRMQLGINGGSAFYRWLMKNDYPEGFQVLCWNCQEAKNFYGKCPHANPYVYKPDPVGCCS